MTTTSAQDEVAARLEAADTLCELVLSTASVHPDRIALRSHEYGTEWTFQQARARIGAVAERLRAMGVGQGDVVALMMRNLPQFHVIDAAVMFLGAVPFSIYNTSSADQIQFLLSDSGARMAVAESGFVPELRKAQALGAPDTPIVLIDRQSDGHESLVEELTSDETGFDFSHALSVGADDLLTLIYTSGTTGPPKGVELTHAGMLAQLRGVHAAVPLPDGGRTLGYLPTAHVAERWFSHYSAFMTYGGTVTTIAEAPNLPAAVASTRPTTFGASPRIWEKFKAAVEADHPGDLLADAAADSRIAAGVRERLGLEEASWVFTGAAPTPVALVEFFSALGLPLCEVLGMSETSGCASVSTPDSIRPGSVGRPVGQLESRVAADGELLLRGPQIMRGYRSQPERTAESIDTDGWLHTGDIARIDDDGRIWIVDRKKDIIISAGGKNMSPANIEMAVLSAGSYVGQVCVIGDGRPYIVALIVPEPALADGRSADDPGLTTEIDAQIRRANAKLARAEQIKKFTILRDEWVLGVELTPTMKLKRPVITARYRDEIDRLYREP